MKQLNNETIEQSILKTLAYADVFEWPVREDELFVQSQIPASPAGRSNLSAKGRSASGRKSQNQNLKLKTILSQLIKKKIISNIHNFYFLFGRNGLVKRRLEREKWAKDKLIIARKAAWRLKLIPSILLVGVSGGLAVGNVTQDDDIDFFIVCRNGTLWTTRFLAILLLELLGCRRKPGDKYYKNKICLNMFVDGEGMAVPAAERDIYTAHEIKQLKVVWEKEGTYQKFLEVNQWLGASKSKIQVKSKKFLILNCNFEFCIFNFALSSLEKLLRWLQIKYMKGRRTWEKIEPHRLLFHPRDKRMEVLEKYQQKLRELKIHDSKNDR